MEKTPTLLMEHEIKSMELGTAISFHVYLQMCSLSINKIAVKCVQLRCSELFMKCKCIRVRTKQYEKSGKLNLVFRCSVLDFRKLFMVSHETCRYFVDCPFIYSYVATRG